jgi:hypothetical protein
MKIKNAPHFGNLVLYIMILDQIFPKFDPPPFPMCYHTETNVSEEKTNKMEYSLEKKLYL